MFQARTPTDLVPDATGRYKLLSALDDDNSNVVFVSPEDVVELRVNLTQTDNYVPASFKVFSKLKSLMFTGDHVRIPRVTLGSQFELPTTTDSLLFKYVNVEGIEYLTQLSHVRKLALGGMSLTFQQLFVISLQLVWLEELYMNQIPLPAHTIFNISNLVKLKTFMFCPYIPVTGFQVVGWHELENLENLSLDLQPTFIDELNIPDWKNLKKLHLCSDAVNISPQWFEKLTNLEQLTFNMHDLSKIPDNIDNLRKLRLLSVWSLRDGAVLPASLSNIATLQTVEVYDTSIVPESMITSNVELFLVKPNEPRVDHWSEVNNNLLQRIQSRQNCPVSLMTLGLRWINSHRGLFETNLNIPEELLERIKVQ